MENNEIMQRLLQDDKPSTNPDEKSWVAEKHSNNKDAQISRIRVVTAKYKVYIVLVLIVIAALLFKYIPDASDAYDASLVNYGNVNSRLSNLEININQANMDMEYLCDKDIWVVANEKVLKKCLNEDKACDRLPEWWKSWTWEDAVYNFNIPLSYLQLHSLYNKKMPVDEKRVLKNLNEYLIKKEIDWWDKDKVWNILRIEIWDPKAIQWNERFFEVPVNVEIEFPNVEDLVWFLYNIEKKLIDNWEDRILYKIQSVSYDIVANDEPQITDISMIAYYYHDERFNDKVECSDEEDEVQELNEEEKSEEETVEIPDDKKSFFKELFK